MLSPGEGFGSTRSLDRSAPGGRSEKEVLSRQALRLQPHDHLQPAAPAGEVLATGQATFFWINAAQRGRRRP
jgi:hypothetical protein